MTRRDGLVLLAGGLLSACGRGGVGSAGDVATTGAAPVPAATPTTSPTPLPATAGLPMPATPTPGLMTLAQERGMRFGSAVAWGPPNSNTGSFANPSYAALLTGECDLLVAENEMKWQHLRPSADTFRFAEFDAIIDWGDTHGMATRGHNLLWHQNKWLPSWLVGYDFGAQPRAVGERLLTDHIRTVCARYGTRIGSYDVVNEAVVPADGTLYNTSLSTAIGSPEATLDLAFRTARAAAPHAQLVYNDYMSWEPGHEQHRAGVLKLLRGFRDRGVPIDALGIQSHIVTQGADSAATVRALTPTWRGFLDEVVGMGYALLVTEFDVRDNDLPADPVRRDAAVAAYGRGYLDVMYAYPQLRDVLAWGMCDRYSWIEGFEPRKDRAPRRPTPYDRDFAAKPLRGGIADAFRAAKER